MNVEPGERYQSVRTSIHREVLSAVAIVALLLGLFAVLSPFLEPLAWGVVVTLSTWPLYRALEQAIPNRPSIAAAIMTLGVATVIILLVAPLLFTFGDELQRSAGSFRDTLSAQTLAVPGFVLAIPLIGDEVHTYLDRLLHERARIAELWNEYQPAILQVAGRFAAGAAGAVLKLFVTLFVVYFLYRHGRHLGAEIQRAATKIGGPRAQHFIDTFRATVRGTVYGILLTAVAQGFLAGIGFWISGAPFPVLLGFATLVLSFIPLGPPFLYLPVAAWIVLAGAPWWYGVLLAAWGVGVVSMADNVLRPLFISQATNMSILLVVFGVVGGLLHFGLLGLFIGPVLIALALTLWREWLDSEREL